MTFWDFAHEHFVGLALTGLVALFMVLLMIEAWHVRRCQLAGLRMAHEEPVDDEASEDEAGEETSR